jgi:hypothetical protein
MPKYVIGSPTGLLVRGTVNLDVRAAPLVHNKDGSISSVFSGSYGVGSNENTGRIHIPPKLRQKYKTFEILVPFVIRRGGRWIRLGPNDWKTARGYAESTGKFMGVFDNAHHANIYGTLVHNVLAREAFKKMGQRR